MPDHARCAGEADEHRDAVRKHESEGAQHVKEHDNAIHCPHGTRAGWQGNDIIEVTSERRHTR